MARSALFHRLRRLMRQARASSPGATPPARREGPSRRDFLSTLGALAVLPAAAACGDNTRIGGDPRIAIVGGGVAGLSAAHFLALAGVRAEVYEASTRIGGRMFTARGELEAEQLVELGGELIDSNHLVIPTLCHSFGLTLDDLYEETRVLTQDTFYFEGRVLADQEIVTAFTPVATKMLMAVAASEGTDAASVAEFERIDALSIPEWLQTEALLAPSTVIRRLLEVAYLEEYGLEVGEQSAWNLIFLIDYEEPDPFRVFGDSDERYHIHQGNDALPSAIGARLEAQLHLEHRLTKVVGAENRYLLTFETPEGSFETEVEHVVYALPFTKLREVDLAGTDLSAGKREVIDELGYGTNAKLMMQFTDRHWELAHGSGGGAITDVGELQAVWATSRGQGGVQGILTNFVGGGRGVAIGDGTAESQAEMVLPWIESVFPGTAAKYVAGSAIRQHWPSYEFTKGSYGCYRVGQWRFFGLEGAREGNSHFCGEHCSEDFQGYMEGGAETGTLVAAEILDDLEVDHPPILEQLLSMIAARPRASYHAGFGEKMRINQIRRR